MTGSTDREGISVPVIRLRGVRTRNLKGLDLDIPHGQWLAICGLAGSGKSSLAVDTLLSEGQRRFIESFSVSARQYLQKWEKPDAGWIDGIPPSVAIRLPEGKASRRTTVGDVTDIGDFLGDLFSRVAVSFCARCKRPIQAHSPEEAARKLLETVSGRRAMVVLPWHPASPEERVSALAVFQKAGFRRVVYDGKTRELADVVEPDPAFPKPLRILVDRVVIAETGLSRLIDSIRTAMNFSHGGAGVLVEDETGSEVIDGRTFAVFQFRDRLICPECETDYSPSGAPCFSHHDPRGACSRCEGAGTVDSPTQENTSDPDGERATCPQCGGLRLNPTALAWKVLDLNIGEVAQLPVTGTANWLRKVAAGGAVPEELLDQIRRRLAMLIELGLGYLTLNRGVECLNRGERQRVELARLACSSLVNILVVLDEFSSGLHPADVENVIPHLRGLVQRGNTLVMADHSLKLIEAADRVIELGPQSGPRGGNLVFEGTSDELRRRSDTATGPWLAGERGWNCSRERRTQWRGTLRLHGVTVRNLHSLEVEIPLGVFCVVTGVCGAGKRTLVMKALAGALQRNDGKDSAGECRAVQRVSGAERVDEVVVMDQRLPMRSRRTNPATWSGAFGMIRQVFANTGEAKALGLKAGSFSFNIPGGRCEACRGEGFRTIDMQFMADVRTTCDECGGARFGPAVLQARYRNHTISEVLQMPCGDAFRFFRGERKLQARLKLLKDAGLEYVPLGQPLSTLSNGERQRLRLAPFLSSRSRKRMLLLMDEPSTGLHPAEIPSLITSLHTLVDVGYSLVAVENQVQMIASADWVIDLGPGAAEAGGRILAAGTPEQVMDSENSITGKYLRALRTQGSG